MDFKRGDNLADVGLAGPHFSAVVNEVEYDIIDKLNRFNAWVDMSNTLNPEPIFQQQHCTWLCFTRSGKELVLRWLPKEKCWELDGLVPAQPKPDDGDEGGCAAAPDDEPPEQPSGGAIELVLSGGFHLPPEESKKRPTRQRRWTRRRPPEDPPVSGPTEREPVAAAAAKRKTKRITKRPHKRIMLRTRALLRSVQRSPRFRHMCSQIDATVADMKALGLLSRDTLHALANAAHYEISRAIADVRALFIERLEPLPQSQIVPEPQRIEIRPGFTLILYNFEGERPNWDAWLFGKLEIDYPNWESWLFGRPAEDEQKVA